MGKESPSSPGQHARQKGLEVVDGAPLLMQLQATGEIVVGIERVRTETFRLSLRGCETHYRRFPVVQAM